MSGDWVKFSRNESSRNLSRAFNLIRLHSVSLYIVMLLLFVWLDYIVFSLINLIAETCNIYLVLILLSIDVFLRANKNRLLLENYRN